MTVIAVVTVKIKNRDAYMRYDEKFMDVFSKFKGTLLAADFDPKPLAGDWSGDRLVLMSFPDEAAMKEWMTSPEYQVIAKDRDEGADLTVTLAQGLDL